MNNQEDEKIEDFEQAKYKRSSNQPNSSSKEATKTAAKGAANAYLGPVGGKAVDALSKTKLGDAILTKGAQALERQPMGRQLAKVADKSGALKAANQTMDAKTGGGDAPTSSGSAPTSNMDVTEENSSNSGINNLMGNILGGNKTSGNASGNIDINGETTATDKLIGFISKHKFKIIAAVISSFFIIFVILIIGGTVVSFAEGTVEFFRDSWDSIKKFVTGDKSTQEWEFEYYKKLDEVQEKLNDKYGVCIDVNLITATLTVNIAGDHYINQGIDEVDPEVQGGSELEISGRDYKKMIHQIELLGNMQIKRTIYGLDERVKEANAGTGISNDYCKENAEEYVVTSDEEKPYFKESENKFSELLKQLKELSSGIPVRNSSSIRLIASNDIEPGVWKFFTKKAKHEQNIEYKFIVPAYDYENILDEQKNVIGTQKVCKASVPEDPYDFAKLDVGSLNDMENNVYYWNLMDSFIAEYYKDYLPQVSEPQEVGSEAYEKIKNIVSDIYLLYNEMGPSRMCESAPTKNYCVYPDSGGQKFGNVQVALLQCADDTRFDPIPNETIVDLETYITGVVYAENGGSSNYEALKAQAVAARTYALTNYDKMETDANGNTLIKLRNCTERQVYCDPNNGCWSNDSTAGGTVHSGQDASKPYNKGPLPSTSMVWTAVKETAGEVLLDSSGNILSIGYSATEQNKWNAMSTDYITMLMDTYASADTIDSDCKTVGDVTGGGTQDGELTKGDCSNYSSSSPYWSTLNIFNEPQCTWYSYGRALQILVESAGMNVNDARSLMNSMYSSPYGRHAGVWYAMNAQTKTFNASTNIDDARPGALAIWGNNDPNNPYGHVAVVESVNKNADGTINTVTFTEGNVKMNGNVLRCWNNTKNRAKIMNPSNTRYFIGYIYLLN